MALQKPIGFGIGCDFDFSVGHDVGTYEDLNHHDQPIPSEFRLQISFIWQCEKIAMYSR